MKEQSLSILFPRQMDSAASMLAGRITRRLKDMLGKYLNVSVREIAALIPELMYYTRWAEYIGKCTEKGWTFSKPETRQDPGDAAGMAAEGKSFARDIAEKYGVTYESLTGAKPILD